MKPNPNADSSIRLVLDAKVHHLGEFEVRRLLPRASCRMVGPWIFFDHMGPTSFSPGSGVDVRPHPHIGLATVTYLFDGEILHRDSLGTHQVIRPGAVNLMVAGRGITHSERETPSVRNSTHNVHGLQLWLALPESSEEGDPSFHHHPKEDLPTATSMGLTARVLIGTAYGVASPVPAHSPTVYVDLHIQADTNIELPDATERAVYVVSGAVEIDGRALMPSQMGVLQPGTRHLLARQDSHVVMIGGDPVGKRFVEWNFVSSRRASIDEAKTLWRSGGFPVVPDDETEFIPLPGS